MDVVTFGQYMQPTKRHLLVKEYVTPGKFNWWAEQAKALCFLYVVSGLKTSLNKEETFRTTSTNVLQGRRILLQERGSEATAEGRGAQGVASLKMALSRKAKSVWLSRHCYSFSLRILNLVEQLCLSVECCIEDSSS